MRYYSKIIFDQLNTPPAPQANAIAYPSGANPIPKKFLSLTAGTSMTTMTTAGGINYAVMSKSDSNIIVASLIFTASSTVPHRSSNQGTSWSANTLSGSNYGIPHAAHDGSAWGVGRATTPHLIYWGAFIASNFVSGIDSGRTPTRFSLFFNNGKRYYFRTSGTTGHLDNNNATYDPFSYPWIAAHGDITTTTPQVGWIIRLTGGHQVAYSSDFVTWTTLTLNASTTQTNPMIKVSADGQKIFAVFDVNNAYTSINGGSSWTGPFALPTGFNVFTITGTETLAMLGGCKSTANGTFFYSSDMGVTWSEKVDGGTAVPFSALVMWD